MLLLIFAFWVCVPLMIIGLFAGFRYSFSGAELGREVKAGEGLANFPLILKRLKDVGYTGCFTIEREISGEEQIADIVHARDMLRAIDAELAE